MGQNLIIVVFAVVVIGGMGSIMGSILTGLGLGVIEGFTKVFYPEASSTVVFVIMVIVLLIRPAGLFGKRNKGPHHELKKESPMWDTACCCWAWLQHLCWCVSRVRHEAHVLRPVCLCIQPAAGLHRASLFRPRGLLRWRRVRGWSRDESLGLTPEVGLLLGTFGGALLGLIFGWLAIRRQGIYFSMITLALAQMLFFVCLQAPFTGGEDGLQGVPRGKLLGLIDLQNDVTMYYVAS